MTNSSRKTPHLAHDQHTLPKGRVITLGASARKRERTLWTALGTVSMALIALVFAEAWMFHNGTLLIATKAAAPTTAAMPTPAPVAQALPPANMKPPMKPVIQTVTATMAPPPPTGKYDDIVLPAQRPALTIAAPVTAPAAVPAAPKHMTVAPESPMTQSATKPVVVASPAPLAVTSHTTVAVPTPTPEPAHTSASAPAAPAAVPSSPALDEAHADLGKGNYAAALAIYDRILDRDSKNVAALKGKAYALQRTEQYEAAAEIDHQLLKLNPDDQDARTGLTAALGQSYMPSSMTELQKMVDADPSNAPAQAALANLQARRGYFDKAFVHLNRAAELAPANLTYRLDLAILYDKSGHKAEALTLYQQVLNADLDQDQASRLPMSMDAIHARVNYLQSATVPAK